MTSDKLYVGKIVNTHGIKGEVRVQSSTNQPNERYRVGNILYLSNGDDFFPVTIARFRQHKNFDLLTFKEFESINDIEPYINYQLWVSADQINDLSENEYYVHEIIGYQVVDESEEVIGLLKEVLAFPANDVWVVERNENNDLLLPAIHEVIRQIDHEKQCISVHILEGLDDED